MKIMTGKRNEKSYNKWQNLAKKKKKTQPYDDDNEYDNNNKTHQANAYQSCRRIG